MTTTTFSRLERAAALFRALADPTRLSIIDRLRDGEQCVCDLMDALDAGQSRMSFHLKALKDVGLLTDRRQGRWIYYSLNQETLAEAHAAIAGMDLALARPGAAVKKCCG